MKIKIPSIRKVCVDAINTLMRFPFALAASFLGTVAAIFLIQHEHDANEQYYYLFKVIMCCALGLSLFLSIILYCESKKYSKKTAFILQFAGVLLLIAYYFSLPGFAFHHSGELNHLIRFYLFIIGIHLLVAFATPGKVNGFWQFNRILFIRFLTAVLYSVVLYSGLALALLAIDNLFDVEIDWKYYSYLWCFIAGVFNTWFFLAGVPVNTEELDTLDEYPKELKIFTQFVLLPLVTIYLAILYAYAGKIIIEWDLPKGWVSYLVLGFSIAGIFSLLLIHPIRNKEGNAWIRIFARWFYTALFPLVVLLMIAIGKRVSDYGITENRYFVLVLAFWLIAIAFYFLVSKSKNIKVIPVSLCLIAFLSSFGTWGAISVSERSQKNRLEKLLVEVNMFANGKVHPIKEKITAAKGKEINSIFEYLDNYHNLNDLQPWFESNLDTLFKKDTIDRYYSNKSNTLISYLGLNKYSYKHDSSSFSFYSSRTINVIDVRGYDFYHTLNMYYYDYEKKPYEFSDSLLIGADWLRIQYFLADKSMRLFRNDTLFIAFDIEKHIQMFNDAPNQQTNSYDYYYKYIDPLQLIIEGENEKIKVKFAINSIHGNTTNNSLKLSDLNAAMLIKFKE